MTRLRTTKRFERDVERAQRRHKDLDKLWAVVERLIAGTPLEPQHHQHPLSGSGNGLGNATSSLTGCSYGSFKTGS